MRRTLRIVLLIVVLAGAVATTGLVMAHLAIRRERPPLPEPRVVASAPVPPDAPVAVRYLNTARQPMARASVLDSRRDPTPDAAYVMGHPSIVLEWGDGRLALIDAGMTREAALAFGRPMQWLGAAPIEALGSVGEQLGPARARVRAILFTHLHTDHTEGIQSLCDGDRTIRAIMTEAQAERPNYLTRPGLGLIRAAPCVTMEEVHGGPVIDVPGFPGLAVIHAGGHTPGSQILLVTLAGAGGPVRYAFAGDLANAFDGIRHEVPKPPLYSLLVVPEDRGRLGELRAFLRALMELGVTVVVAHDLQALESSGIARFTR